MEVGAAIFMRAENVNASAMLEDQKGKEIQLNGESAQQAVMGRRWIF